MIQVVSFDGLIYFGLLLRFFLTGVAIGGGAGGQIFNCPLKLLSEPRCPSTVVFLRY